MVKFTPPPQFADRKTSDLVKDVEALIRDEQTAVQAGWAQERLSVLGVRAVLRADPFDAPRSRRPTGRLNPRLAAGGHEAAMKQSIQALRGFRDAYREAWQAFRQNLKTTFHGGSTYARRRGGMRCKSMEAVCGWPLGAEWLFWSAI